VYRCSFPLARHYSCSQGLPEQTGERCSKDRRAESQKQRRYLVKTSRCRSQCVQHPIGLQNIETKRCPSTLIPVVEQTKFLGVIFDNKLTFRPHIRYLKEKSVKSLNLLRVVAYTFWGADQQTLLHLFRSLVRSKVDYGSVVYGSARESYLRILYPIHNHALRLYLGAFRTSPASSLCVQANEPPLYIRRRMLSIQYSLRLGSSPSNPAYNTVYSPKFKASFSSKPNQITTLCIRIAPNLKRLVLSGILYLSYLFQPLLHGCQGALK